MRAFPGWGYGLKLIYDIHTHTDYTHGHSTIEEMVCSAREKKLKGIYITEHAMNHYYARHLDRSKYAQMKAEIVRLREKYPDIEIVFGVEANFISTDGQLDIPQEDIGMYEVILAGFHVMCSMKTLSDFFKLKVLALLANKLKLGFLKSLSSKYCTEAALNALDRYKIMMITHPMSNYCFDLRAVAEKCARKGTLLEINNPRQLLNVQYIASISDIPVRFGVGSDAHHKDVVGEVFDSFHIIAQSGLAPDRVENVSFD